MHTVTKYSSSMCTTRIIRYIYIYTPRSIILFSIMLSSTLRAKFEHLRFLSLYKEHIMLAQVRYLQIPVDDSGIFFDSRLFLANKN